MFTKIGKEEIIEECAELIKRGEIVAFPTETVYGLGGDAFNEAAVKKIYEAKNRPSDNPFIVHVPDVGRVEDAAYLTPEAERIFEAFAPGPITIVLKKKEKIPYCVTAGLDTVGIRIPEHPMARKFLTACGTPIAAPSANLSKRVSPTTAERVYEDMNGRIPAILDGGACRVGIESTVLSLVGEPTILRPGAITAEMLAPYLPSVKTHTGKVIVAPAPGMKYAHYCPSVPCELFSSVEAAVKEFAKRKEEGLNPVVLALEKTCSALREAGAECVSLGKNTEEYAHNIFEAMRKCEKKYGFILAEALQGDGLEASVMNRILKSSRGIIV
ncbi:MAG: L-threonylcarbamoyladenylate synthase [Christensenellales bacterium]